MTDFPSLETPQVVVTPVVTQPVAPPPPAPTPPPAPAPVASTDPVVVATISVSPVVHAAAPAATAKRATRANVRRVALSALKTFAMAAGAVVITKQAALTGPITLSAAEGIGLAALVAGGDAAAKVLEVFLEG